MADPAAYRPAQGSIPVEPGVYRFSDADGRVIYVGKAKSLRQRLSSYFADLSSLHPRTQNMVTTAASVDWTVVRTEVEALQLEYTWIKQFDPRFNVRYRDDKSYPSLAVTLDEVYPRLLVMRGPRRKGVRYFGPYSHAWAIRETLDLLLRVFPARTCSNGVFTRAGQIGRPCLLGYIGKCSAPCVDRVSAAEHRSIVDDFCDFMAGKTDGLIRRLEREMLAAAAEFDYERAARLRDDLGAVRRAMEKQAVVLGDGTDADVVALAEDALEAAVAVFHVRGGRIRGQRGWVVDKVENVTTGDLVEQLLLQVYGGEGDLEVPREVLVPVLPEDAGALTDLLEAARGTRVDLRVPRRGDKRALMETVARNATLALAQHKLKRSSDLTARSRALAELHEALGLNQAPLRIECFDISNLAGASVVASMVVFEDGLARRNAYRRFSVRSVGEASVEGDPVGGDHSGANDVAAMYEVVHRRFSRYLEERARTGDLEPDGEDSAGRSVRVAELVDPETGRPRKFAYPPQLVVVDGGPPQVAAAARALADLGIEDIALVGLAKRLEEVWLPGVPDPVILPRSSEGLYLLQRVRDEAHRFAITYHRQKRSSSVTTSALDAVKGLGATRRAALLKAFGSVRKLTQASVEEIAAVAGIGPRTAAAVVAALAELPSPGPSVNVTTGEIIDGESPGGKPPGGATSNREQPPGMTSCVGVPPSQPGPNEGKR